VGRRNSFPFSCLLRISYFLPTSPALRDIPVVFLSARAGEEALSEGITVGADDYLIKPFSAKELLARVNARIELSKFRLAAARQEQVLRKEAEDANNAKDRFLAVLSHGEPTTFLLNSLHQSLNSSPTELRTPLTPVLLLAEEAQRNMQLSERIREDMRMIARNVRLETQLIDDLLDLTKVSERKMTLPPRQRY
jgi:response regulator RpfG family c-di-GMP phosphodiesterase